METFDVEVLNTPDNLTEEDTKRFFIQFGKVLSVTLQPFTRRAIVGFSSEDGRTKAINLANGQTLGDR
jgi:RNA recognition motif-containing protein